MTPTRKANQATADTHQRQPTPTTLQRYSATALTDLFAALDAPAADELAGNYRGTLMTVEMLEKLPAVIQSLVHSVASLFWREKSFAEGKGTNIWLLPNGLELVSYKTDVRRSVLDTGDVLAIDYAIAANPGPIKNILGEVRKLSESTYLARMLYRTARGAVPIMYFTLEQ